MPLRARVLEELLERIGQGYRARIERAVRLEEDKALGQALREWEEILAEVRREGRDIAGLGVRQHLQRLHQLWWQMGGPQHRREDPSAHPAPPLEPGLSESRTHPGYEDLKHSLRAELQGRCLSQGVDLTSQSEENRIRILGILDQILKEHLKQIPESVKRKDLMDEIMNDVLGLGVVEAYLKDPTINEVMVNGKEVYYEKDGRIHLSPRGFPCEDDVRKVIERILYPIGRRVDASSPLVDGRLPDGSRVNIVLPPVALDGPVITIRKFAPSIYSARAMIAMGSLSEKMAAFFRLIVLHRLNVMISGRTSAGKTTMLNLLASFIEGGERIVTIEEMAELQLPQPHVVRLEARAPNIQGKGEITVRTLFRNALHMRPDRIIVGECRGVETLDMLQAMNTGHDGSISTAHSNSPRDLFARLEAMVGMSEASVNAQTVRRQIASGIDVVVYCTRFPDGRRKVTSVCEIMEGDDPAEAIAVKEIYRFERTGVDEKGFVRGAFVATGHVPCFVRQAADLREDPKVLDLFERDDVGEGLPVEPA